MFEQLQSRGIFKYCMYFKYTKELAYILFLQKNVVENN